MVILAIIDFKTYLLPNIFVFPFAITGILFHFFTDFYYLSLNQMLIGGLVGFGLDRKTNEDTLIYYLQKFSDDEHMALIRERLSDSDMEALFDLLTGLLKCHLSEKEYHRVFLKE